MLEGSAYNLVFTSSLTDKEVTGFFLMWPHDWKAQRTMFAI